MVTLRGQVWSCRVKSLRQKFASCGRTRRLPYDSEEPGGLRKTSIIYSFVCISGTSLYVTIEYIITAKSLALNRESLSLFSRGRTLVGGPFIHSVLNHRRHPDPRHLWLSRIFVHSTLSHFFDRYRTPYITLVLPETEYILL